MLSSRRIRENLADRLRDGSVLMLLAVALILLSR